jgi:hypothetical protein
MSGSSAGRAWVAAASFTAGGTETLSVPREAGHAGLARVKSNQIGAVFKAFVLSEKMSRLSLC